MAMSRGFAFLLILILAVSCLITVKPAFSFTSAAENTWTGKAPMPTARDDLGVAVVNGKIYAIGGTVLVYQDAVHTESKDVGVNEVYDPATNTWTTKKPMPIPSSGFATAVYQDKIYCIGGGVTDFYNASKGNWDIKLGVGFNQVYDPATDKWENRTSMPIPEINSKASVVNGKIYLLGGHPNITLNEVYDPLADNWTSKSPMPEGFYGVPTVYSDKIYAVGRGLEGGSYDSNGHYVLTKITPMTQIYNPEKDTWTLAATTGPKFYTESFSIATSGIIAPKKIYVFYNPSDAPNNKLYMNQAYDPETGSWENGAGIPTQRNSFAVAVVDDLIYVIGGLTITFPIPTLGTNPTSVTTIYSTVEQYTPFGYGTVPPQVSLVSSETLNTTASQVSLNFTINRPVDWMSYSLDGKDNITIKGNTTITGLSAGLHNITVYAKDANGIVGGSETINFTIVKSSLTVSITAVSIVVIVFGVGLLVFYRKHCHEAVRP
jgi:hypothetical protein